MSSNNDGCGCDTFLYIIAIAIVMFLNPSLDDGKKKVEADVSNRTLIEENNVRLYRKSYFIFSEFYLEVGYEKPKIMGIGFLGFIFEKHSGGLNKNGKFSETVKLE